MMVFRSSETIRLNDYRVCGPDTIDLLYLGKTVPVYDAGEPVGTLHIEGGAIIPTLHGKRYMQIPYDWMRSLFTTGVAIRVISTIPEAS